MRLFLLSLLAIGSAQAYTIGNPYRSAYWAYNPARGEFPVQSSVLHGYLSYFDNSGNERLVTYNYPEPVYGIRQSSYASGEQAGSSSALRTFGQDDSSEFARAREAHFRAWALQQYRALKCEMDALRAEGKEPSADMYAKFRPLEKIALTAEYSEISDIPEVKRISQDHLHIWNEVRNKNLQTEAGHSTYQQSTVKDIQGELKTYNGHPTSTQLTVEGTQEQKQAHDEHLRIHSEQIANLRKLELEHQQQFEHKPAAQQQQQAEALAEFERAKQEHLRLWNEAKLRAEQANFNVHGVTATENKEYGGAAKQQISALKYDQSQSTQEYVGAAKPQISALKYDQSQSTQHQEQFKQQSADFQKAHDDHLRLVSEATQRIHSANEHNKQIEEQNLKTSIASTIHPTEQQTGHSDQLNQLELAKQEHLRLWNEAKLRSEQASFNIDANKESAKHDQYTYTNQESDEIQKARDEHLRLVNEATQRIHAAQTQTTQIEQGNLKYDVNQNQQVLDTPEVQQARLEHLRLVNEANLRAQIAEQQELQNKQQSTTHTGEQSQYLLAKTETETKGNQAISELKYDHNIDQQQHKDHVDFQKAHDDHVRLVNEATLKIKAAEEHIKQLEAQQLTTAESKTISQQHSIEQTNLKSTLPIGHQQVMDTPEVIRAREEHLRLVNEAKLRAESVEQKELKYKQENEQESHQIPLLKTQYQHQPIHFQQQQQVSYHYEQPQGIQFTPEVIKAREEHLRLVNEAKLNAKIEDQNTHSQAEQQSNLKHQSLHFEQQQGTGQYNQLYIQDTPEVIKAREEHLRLFNEAKGDQNAQYNSEQQNSFKSHSHQEHYQQQGFQQSSGTQHHIEETPEVKQAREEHLRIFNTVKSLNEQEGAKTAELKSSTNIPKHLTNEEEELLKEETRLLELQGLREAERLQEQYKQLELERIRETERLAGEQQQIKAELKLLKIEEDKRFQMEKLLEEERLKKEQQELQRLTIEENKKTESQAAISLIKPQISIIPYTQPLAIRQLDLNQQHKYPNNPYLRANPIQSQVVNQFQQQQQQQQQGQQFAYSHNPFLKTTSIKTPIVYYPISITPNNVQVQPTNLPLNNVARYVQSSQHLNTGSKQQHIKDDFIKNKFTNTASTQPADTAVALSALQRATNEHFRAHEQALQHLRLAKLQDPDCN